MASSALPIFDGHNDVLLRLWRQGDGTGRSFVEDLTTGHLNLAKARAGGFAGGLFATFVPSRRRADPTRAEEATGVYEVPLPETPSLAIAQHKTMAMAALLGRLEALSAGAVSWVRSVAEIEAAMARGSIAASWHIEGAEAIDPDLHALEVFQRAGLRSLGLVWSRANAFGTGVPFKFPSSPDLGPGLSEAGKALVTACNRLRVLIDLSHLNEAGFWDVAALSDAPLVATHSNVHALCPVSRNLTDKQLDAIRASDGMVGLNFAVCFLREDGTNNADTPLAVLVRHIDYLVERLGPTRVGLGSDFDGATMPRELADAGGLQRLIAALRAHGYDQALLENLAYRNWLRVLRATWGA